MNEEAERPDDGAAAPAQRAENQVRHERPEPVGNVRDVRGRAARQPAVEAGHSEGELEGVRDNDSIADEGFEPAGDVAEAGDDEPVAGDDARGAHRKGRKRRRRGRGEDSEGAGANAPQERVSLDPEQVAKRAWKIYLGEVSEEGLALINDNTAREMARRSFRIAEIFLEEQARHS